MTKEKQIEQLRLAAEILEKGLDATHWEYRNNLFNGLWRNPFGEDILQLISHGYEIRIVHTKTVPLTYDDVMPGMVVKRKFNKSRYLVTSVEPRGLWIHGWGMESYSFFCENFERWDGAAWIPCTKEIARVTSNDLPPLAAHKIMNETKYPKSAEDYLIDNGTKCHEQIKSDLQTLLNSYHELAALKERMSKGVRARHYIDHITGVVAFESNRHTPSCTIILD